MDIYAYIVNDKKLKAMILRPNMFSTAIEGALQTQRASYFNSWRLHCHQIASFKKRIKLKVLATIFDGLKGFAISR